jgi:hypothetical protein
MVDKRDVFLSHASEDKSQFVRPLAEALDKARISYWIDEAEIKWGDSITKGLNDGLRKSQYVIVFLSDQFLGKKWPEAELGAALSKENSRGHTVVLPLLTSDLKDVYDRYPLLQDKMCLQWSEGIPTIVTHLKRLLSADSGAGDVYEPMPVRVHNDIILHVSVNSEDTNDVISAHFDESALTRLRYQASDTGQEIYIDPHMKYFSKLNDEKLLPPLWFWNSPFEWQFPNLDIKIVNNGKETIFITEAVLEVERSTVDPWPVLVLRDRPVNGFYIRNEGWGSVHDCTIRYNVLPLSAEVSYEGPYRFIEQAGTFDYGYEVSLEKVFQSMSINPGELLKEYDSERWGSKTPQNRPGKSGQFTGEGVRVVGEITFSGTTVKSERRTDTVRFSVHIEFDHRVGAPMGPTYQYNIMLHDEGSQYKARVPVSHVIKSGEADRFGILVGTPKSSLHRFRLQLHYNNGQVLVSKPINLVLFMPRSQVHALSNQAGEGIQPPGRLSNQASEGIQPPGSRLSQALQRALARLLKRS